MSINVNSLDDIVYVITNEDEVVYLTTIPNDIGQSPIQFQEEGVNVGAAGSVNTIDFVGATVTISQAGGKLTVTITSAAGGGVTAVGNLTPLFTASIAGVTMSFAQIVKAANLIFAGPATGADANPDFRALVAADIPGSTVGLALLALTNPGAITFLRINADNTVTALSAADFNTAIGQPARVILSGSDFSTTSTTLVDVTGLSFAVVAGTYKFTFVAYFTCSATTIGAGWGVNTGATTTFVAGIYRNPNTAAGGVLNGAINALNTTAGGSSSNSMGTGGNFLIFEGIITVATSGTVILQAQVESTGTLVVKGSNLSYVEYVKIA